MECEHKRSSCTDSRKKHGYCIRRRKCYDCGEMFSTVELPFTPSKGRSSREALKRQLVREWLEDESVKMGL